MQNSEMLATPEFWRYREFHGETLCGLFSKLLSVVVSILVDLPLNSGGGGGGFLSGSYQYL